jgi:hypothetical protein
MGQWRRTKLGGEGNQRLQAEIPIRISTVDPETDPATGLTFFRNVEETAADLSNGGAFVRSWEPLAAHRRVLVEIDLPGERRPIELSARVAWTQLRVRTLERSTEKRTGNPGPIGSSDTPGPSAGAESTKPIDSPGYGIEFDPSNGAALRRIEAFLEERLIVAPLPSVQAQSASGPTSEPEASAPGRATHPDDSRKIASHRTLPNPS